MMDNLDCLALTLGGENQAACVFSAISSEEIVIVSSRWSQKVAVFGVAWRWRNSAKSSCALRRGIPNNDPRSKLALMKSISTPMLSLETVRKMGSEAVASVTGTPERCAG